MRAFIAITPRLVISDVRPRNRISYFSTFRVINEISRTYLQRPEAGFQQKAKRFLKASHSSAGAQAAGTWRGIINTAFHGLFGRPYRGTFLRGDALRAESATNCAISPTKRLRGRAPLTTSCRSFAQARCRRARSHYPAKIYLI